MACSSFFKSLSVLSCLLLHTVSSSPLTRTLATTTAPVAKRQADIPGEFIFSVGATTYFGTPTSTVQPTYGTAFSNAVSSAASAAYAKVTASPLDFEVNAAYSTTVNNVETLVVCIVDSMSAHDLGDTADNDLWELIITGAADSYIDDLNVVGEANYLILEDTGDDMVTTIAYVDMQIATSTIGS